MFLAYEANVNRVTPLRRREVESHHRKRLMRPLTDCWSIPQFLFRKTMRERGFAPPRVFSSLRSERSASASFATHARNSRGGSRTHAPVGVRFKSDASTIFATRPNRLGGNRTLTPEGTTS